MSGRLYGIGQGMMMVMAAVALLLGAMQPQGVDATKAGKNTVASVKVRIAAQKDLCELIGGGTLSTKDSPFVPNKITTCTGGDFDGHTCTHTPKKTVCTDPARPLPVSGGVTTPLGTTGGGVAPVNSMAALSQDAPPGPVDLTDAPVAGPSMSGPHDHQGAHANGSGKKHGKRGKHHTR